MKERKNKALYPLTFDPIYKSKIWGGRKFQTVLNRNLPNGAIGESWDVAAHDNGTSVVDCSQLAGLTIPDLIAAYGKEIIKEKTFPLLLKLIDAQQNLSVQVHPDDDYVRKAGIELWGKAELWYIVHSEPGAWIIWGLRPGITKKDFTEAISQGGSAILACLNKVPVKAGELYPISAGLVHALGAGVLVAEIQQNSDTTFRIYDWDRQDEQGKPRELHLEQALESIDFSPEALRAKYHFARCAKYFKTEVLKKPQDDLLQDRQNFEILTCFDHQAEITWNEGIAQLMPGQSCLIPASLQGVKLKSSGVILRSTSTNLECRTDV